MHLRRPLARGAFSMPTIAFVLVVWVDRFGELNARNHRKEV